MNVLLFVSSHCIHCPIAERLVKKVVPDYEEHGLELEKIRTATKEGKQLGKEFNVHGTPTIILINDEDKEIKRFVGTPDETNFRNEIEKMLGLKKSFFARFFG